VLRAPLRRLRRRAIQGLNVTLGLFLFILALELMKESAGGISVLLKSLAVSGPVNALGFGWLVAYLAMSGSPVAATSLTLLAGGVLSPMETFGMINGSRFGASFIVLFVGFIYYLRGIRGRGVVAMGILSMATTATIYLPAMLLGALSLRQGWLNAFRFGSPRILSSIVDFVYDPITTAVAARLPGALTFLVGFVCLLAAFRLFDRALPSMDAARLETRWGRWMSRPYNMFLLGLLVTSITLSVSVSLSLLVPLAARGYVTRPQVIPYIMGANISTFVDTLFASLLIRTPIAFTIVLTEMLSVAVVSMIVLLTFFRVYRDALIEFNGRVTANPTRFAVFVAFLAILPAVLLLI